MTTQNWVIVQDKYEDWKWTLPLAICDNVKDNWNEMYHDI